MRVSECKQFSGKAFEWLPDILAFVVLDVERLCLRQILMPISRIRLFAIKWHWNLQRIPGRNQVSLCLQWQARDIETETFAIAFFEGEFHSPLRRNNFQICKQLIENHVIRALIMQPGLI